MFPGFTRSLSALLASATLLSLPTLASAQEDTPASTDKDSLNDLGTDNTRAWAQGVPIEAQEKARKLFEEANRQILQQYFKQAADLYLEALDHWDHPAIHFNRSLALMNLNQPLALHHSLKNAVKHGVPPLVTEENYKRAQNYLLLESKKLGHLTIRCEEDEVQVTLDGKPLAIHCPQTHKLVVLPGEHLLRATKPGHVDTNKTVVLSMDEQEMVSLRVYTRDELAPEQRRMDRWIPWTVLASGALFLGAGGGLHITSKQGFSNFDTDFDSQCDIGQGSGCSDEEVPELITRLSSSHTQQWIGRAAYSIGGAAVLTGAVLLYVNRGRRIPREELLQDTGAKISNFQIQPSLSPTRATLNASINF